MDLLEPVTNQLTSEEEAAIVAASEDLADALAELDCILLRMEARLKRVVRPPVELLSRPMLVTKSA